MTLPVFTLGPDWSFSVSEKLTWLTEVFTSFDGHEQRVGHRSQPRRTLEYTGSAFGMERRKAEGMVQAALGQQVDLPMYTSELRLGSSVPLNGTQLNITGTCNHMQSREFVGGGRVAFRDSIFHCDIQTLNSVTSSQLQFSPALEHSALANAYPVRIARLMPEVSVNRLTPNLCQLSLRLEILDSPDLTVGTYPQFEGIDVCEMSPNWADGESTTYGRDLRVLDNETIRVPTLLDPAGSSVATSRFSFLLRNFGKVQKYRQWLFTRKGKLVPFWQPSWNSDMVVKYTDPAINSIAVDYAGYVDYMRSKPNRSVIRITTTTGTYYKRVINSWYGDGLEGLQVDALPTGTITSVMFMTKSRLDMDEAEISWVRPGLAQSQMVVKELLYG